MKINDIKTVLTFEQVLESSSPQATDLIFESAAEMVRNIRTIIQKGQVPAESINDTWTSEKIAQFCAGLERIEKVVATQVSDGTIKSELRDTVYTILATSDFNHDKAITLILKQASAEAHGPAVKRWSDLLAAEDTHPLQNELDKVGRDLSSLVALLRTKGAAEVQALKNNQATATQQAAAQVDPIM